MLPPIRLLRSVSVLLTMLFISACTPVVYHQGQYICPPRMEKDHFVTVDGCALPVRSWLPEDGRINAVLVALHGFNDYSNFFDAPGNYFSRHGIACYAYDQRGFGSTPGRGFWYDKKTYTTDAASFVRELRKRHPATPVYLLGESMGGAVTIAAMTAGDPPQVDGVILVAPAVWGRDTMPWYQRWLLSVAAYTFPWIELTGNGLDIWPSDNKEMLRAFSRDPLVIKATRVDAVYGLTNLMDEALSQADKVRPPTLVLYGANDQVIPREPVLRMLGKMPKETRRAFYRHGYHMLLRDLEREEPMEDIAAWIADHGSPLPHGAEHLE